MLNVGKQAQLNDFIVQPIVTILRLANMAPFIPTLHFKIARCIVAIVATVAIVALTAGSVIALANATTGIVIDKPIEIHQRIASPVSPIFNGDMNENTNAKTNANTAPVVALTLDACGGQYDVDLIRLLVVNKIPATVFVTKKWIDRNATGMADLLAHPELFEIEDHGAAHIPAVIGVGKRVYGILGERDIAHLQLEVIGGAASIEARTGRKPRFYRGATAEYDSAALAEIRHMGYQVAGFSVNADAGATLSRHAITERFSNIKNGDIIIAHMNKPAAFTAEGLADALPSLIKRGFKFVKLEEIQLLTLNANVDVDVPNSAPN